MKPILFFFLVITSLLACNKDNASIDNGTGLGACLLDKMTTADGGVTSYKYNSKNQWEGITYTQGAKSASFSLAFDNTIPNGPVVTISNPSNKSLSILDYDKANLLTFVSTNIDKIDLGTILGSPAIGKNVRIELKLSYNSNNKLSKLSHSTTYDVISNNKSNPFSFTGYETYEYNSNGDLIKANYYADVEVEVAGKLVLETDFVGYSVYEYGNESSKLTQNLGLKNLSVDIDLNGQLYIVPSNDSKIASKVTFYSPDDNGGFTPYISNFSLKNNSSGYLLESIDQSDGETIRYTYKNCK
jgi:hypothetical protein